MSIFKKREWSKWEHVKFFERAGAFGPESARELFRREDALSGEAQYKDVKVISGVINATDRLNSWWDNVTKAKASPSPPKDLDTWNGERSLRNVQQSTIL